MGVQGRSLVFNIIFIIVNLIGFSLVAMGFHESFAENAATYKNIGYGLTISTLIGLYIFQGYKMFGYVARVVVGGLFVVSGMIKANDPLGFSYKLEEYFEDGALAYRIKSLGWETFSLEGLIEYALIFSIIICIAEIILGIALLLGAKFKITLWALFGMTVFFGLLTAHTMDCDPQGTFTDVDYYSEADEEYEFYKTFDTSTDSTYTITEEGSQLKVVKEGKMLQCVTDCGCFGDALKGSVGRSLTPAESFWKDLILFYLVLIIVLAYSGFEKNEIRKPINITKIGFLGLTFVVYWFTGMISPFLIMVILVSILGLLRVEKGQMNNALENVILIPASGLVILFFCWVFGWYFPLAFAMVVLVANLFIRRSKNEYIQNEWTLAIFSVFSAGLFVWYVLNYLPMKDYRAYAVGDNILENMKEKRPPKYASVYSYKNIESGEIIELTDSDLSNKNYPDDLFAADGKPAAWEFVDRSDKIIDRGIPAKITDFQPFAFYHELPEYVQKSEGVQNLLKEFEMANSIIDTMYAVHPIDSTWSTDSIPVMDYDTSIYRLDQYHPPVKYVSVEKMYDESQPINLNFTNYLLTNEKVFLMICYDIEKTDQSYKEKIKALYDECRENDVLFYLLSASSAELVKEYINDIDPNIPILSADDKELKIVVRSNPGYIAISDAVVKGKWSYRSLPDFEELNKAFE